MNVKHLQLLEPKTICFSATYHQYYVSLLLFRREVAKNGIKNGFGFLLQV